MLQLFFGQADGEGRGVSEMVVAFAPYGAEKQLALAVQVIPCLRTCSHIQSLQCNIVYGRNGHAVDAGSIQNEPLDRGRQARPHARKGRHAAIRLNRPQAVLEVHFQEAPPAEACTAQEANEGEEEG